MITAKDFGKLVNTRDDVFNRVMDEWLKGIVGKYQSGVRTFKLPNLIPEDCVQDLNYRGFHATLDKDSVDIVTLYLPPQHR